MFGTMEPAVWRLIGQVVRAAKSHGKTAALCGELAADPRMGPQLAGLGVQELSMSPPAIVHAKATLQRQPLEYWQKRAHALLKAETVVEIQAVLESID